MATKELAPTPKDLLRDAVEDKRELAHRSSDRYEVWLWWVRSSGIVSLALRHLQREVEFEISPDKALEAYNHPYSYAALNGFYFEDNRSSGESDG